MSAKKTFIIKLLSFLCLVALVALIVTTVDIQKFADRDYIRGIVEANFLLGAAVFVLAFIAVKFTFVPMTPVTIVGGYIFGGFWGAVFGTLAITLSSMIMFLLAKFFGRGFVKEVTANRFQILNRYDEMIREHGFLVVVFFRIVPVAPLAVVNFGLGLTRLHWWDYLFGTIAGVFPGAFLLANMGDNITDYTSPRFIIYSSLYVLMLLTAFGYAYFRRKRGKRKAETKIEDFKGTKKTGSS